MRMNKHPRKEVNLQVGLGLLKRQVNGNQVPKKKVTKTNRRPQFQSESSLNNNKTFQEGLLLAEIELIW